MTGAQGAGRRGMPTALSFYLFATGHLMPISFIQTNWMLILILVLSGGMLLWPLVQRRLSPMKDVGTLAATQLVNTRNAALLDVREPAEYGAGRLPSSINVPLSQLASQAQDLAKLAGRPVIVYCDRGNRSRGVGAALAKQGITDVYNLAGGFRAWKAAGLPVEQ
jgi:rhodanese-related sulfurtransferase